MRLFEDLSFDEKCRIFSEARVSAARNTVLMDGNFVERWFPKLAGRYVVNRPGGIGYATRQEAIKEARVFRTSCRARRPLPPPPEPSP